MPQASVDTLPILPLRYSRVWERTEMKSWIKIAVIDVLLMIFGREYASDIGYIWIQFSTVISAVKINCHRNRTTNDINDPANVCVTCFVFSFHFMSSFQFCSVEIEKFVLRERMAWPENWRWEGSGGGANDRANVITDVVKIYKLTDWQFIKKARQQLSMRKSNVKIRK